MSMYMDVAKLYVATFNRAPDAAGLDYWTNYSGLSIEGVAQSFFDQPETQVLYPMGTSDTDFVNSVYNNLFNRAAEQAGLDYWVTQLNSGNVSKQNFILAVINGAQNTSLGLDATILDNKQTVGLSFVQHGLDDVSLARSLMSGVTASLSSVESVVASIDHTAPINGMSAVTAGVDGTYLGGSVYDISSDGRYVIMSGTSAQYYTPSSSYSYYGGLFLKDMFTGGVDVVSTNSINTGANGNALYPSMSDDGRYIVFQGNTNNLVSGDTNNSIDIFLKDMESGSLQIISQSGMGVQGNDDSRGASISGDGRYAVFMSDATNLVDGDTNHVADTFIKDLQTGYISRVSLSETGAQGNGTSYGGALSADGRYVAFVSDASNLVAGDTNGHSDIFLWDRTTGGISIVSTTTQGTLTTFDNVATPEHAGWQYNGNYSPSISADGRYVSFLSDATNLSSGLSGGESRSMAISDVYVKDTQTGIVSVVSTTAQGALTTNGANSFSISDDGKYATFTGFGFTSENTNFFGTVYVKNLHTGAIERVSENVAQDPGDGTSFDPHISGDGHYITFSSWSNTLGVGDANTSTPDGLRVVNPLWDLV